jgi:hypothetical protein
MKHCSCPECATERTDAPLYPCAGYSDCEATVERRGGMCVGCSTRLDTARDHSEWADREFSR